MLTRISVSALPLLVACPIAADVLVVGPTGAFANVQAAVDAAQDGDTVLVQFMSAVYPAFEVNGKSLTIVGENGSFLPRVAGPVLVRNIAAQESVVLSQLALNHNGLSYAPALGAQDVAGSLRVRACLLTGGHGEDHEEDIAADPGPGSNGLNGARIVSCADVALSECTIRGGAAGNLSTCTPSGSCCGCGSGAGLSGGNALSVKSSNVALFDCELQGGYGSEADLIGSDGGNAAHLESGASLFASDCTFLGGNGGWATDFIFTLVGGDGGDGLVADAGATAELLAVSLLGGAAGDILVPFTSGQPGNPGVPMSGAGSVSMLPGAPRSVEAPVLLREGEASSLSVVGEPGDVAFLLAAPGGAWLKIAGITGVLLTQAPLVMSLGVLPASGSVTVPILVADLGPLVQGVTVHLQAAAFNGAILLGDAAPSVVIDSAF